MSVVFPYLLTGASYGALIGSGLGLVRAVLHRPVALPVVTYQHPRTKRTHTLDALGLDDEKNQFVVTFLARLGDLLQIDPTVCQPLCMEQYSLVVYHTQHFFATLVRYRSQPETVRYKVNLRDAGLRVIRSLGHFEKLVWNAREVENIMRLVTELQTIVQETLLLADK